MTGVSDSVNSFPFDCDQFPDRNEEQSWPCGVTDVVFKEVEHFGVPAECFAYCQLIDDKQVLFYNIGEDVPALTKMLVLLFHFNEEARYPNVEVVCGVESCVTGHT